MVFYKRKKKEVLTRAFLKEIFWEVPHSLLYFRVTFEQFVDNSCSISMWWIWRSSDSQLRLRISLRSSLKRRLFFYFPFRIYISWMNDKEAKFLCFSTSDLTPYNFLTFTRDTHTRTGRQDCTVFSPAH